MPDLLLTHLRERLDKAIEAAKSQAKEPDLQPFVDRVMFRGHAGTAETIAKAPFELFIQTSGAPCQWWIGAQEIAETPEEVLAARIVQWTREEWQAGKLR